MRFSILGLTILCFGLTLAQDEKRLRLRRPRPFKDIENVDGIAKGRPIPIKSGRSDPSHLLASAFQGQESQQRSQQANAALESLLATAGREVPSRELQPQELIFEEVQRGQIHQQQRAQIPQQQRAQIPQQQRAQIPQQQRAQIPQQQRGRPVEGVEQAQRPTRPRGRTRLPPKIPRRKPSSDSDSETPKKFKPRKPSVKTTERYSHENEDGSFTFGYVSEDGSFREETRGVDCITRGKYGYIDPEGKKREFTYVSGLPCDTPEDGISNDDENSLQRVAQDPVDPAERFRTSNPVQVSENDLPPTLVRSRQRVRRPQSETPVRASSQKRRPQTPTPSSSHENFPSFNRERVRPTTPEPTRRPTVASGALNNLFAIVDDKPTAPATPRRPVTPVTRRPPTPSRAPPSPTPSRFPPSPTPSRFPPSPTPSRFPQSPTPSQRPTAVPSPTPSRRPSPTPTPSRRPSPTPSRRPSPGTFDFQTTLADFENKRPALTFDRPQQGTNKPKSAGPDFSSELSFNPDSGTFQTELRQNFGGQEELRLSQSNAPSGQSNQNSGSFASTTAASPFASFTSTAAAPPRARPRPSSSFGSNAPSLGFQPLDFPDPASVQLPTPTAAPPQKSVFFEPFPSSTAAPPSSPSTTRRPPTSFPVTPTATPVRTLPPSQNRPPPPPRQSRPPIPQPPRQSRPPVPPPPQPFNTASNPPIQFGFNPIASQPQQNRQRPFTAFANGTPPQLSGAPSSFQFQPQSSGQFRSFPQQTSFVPQSAGGSRFPNAGRPPPPPQQSSAASAPFAVFNPAAFASNRRA